jgi:cadmium resistance protein CadD (predicted permease)
VHWPARVVEACGLFVGTNVDDLLLLVAWSADARIPFRRILVGQGLGIGLLFGASLLLGLGAAHVSVFVGRLLGLVPLLLGLFEAREACRRHPHAELSGRGGGESVFSIATLTVTSGGDNVAAYAPAFAKGYGSLAIYAAVFSAMTLVWCMGARALVGHPLVRGAIERVGAWLTPAVLIVVGVLVIAG